MLFDIFREITLKTEKNKSEKRKSFRLPICFLLTTLDKKIIIKIRVPLG